MFTWNEFNWLTTPISGGILFDILILLKIWESWKVYSRLTGMSRWQPRQMLEQWKYRVVCLPLRLSGLSCGGWPKSCDDLCIYKVSSTFPAQGLQFLSPVSSQVRQQRHINLLPYISLLNGVFKDWHVGTHTSHAFRQQNAFILFHHSVILCSINYKVMNI